jgi:hypothetical protein
MNAGQEALMTVIVDVETDTRSERRVAESLAQSLQSRSSGGWVDQPKTWFVGMLQVATS